MQNGNLRCDILDGILELLVSGAHRRCQRDDMLNPTDLFQGILERLLQQFLLLDCGVGVILCDLFALLTAYKCLFRPARAAPRFVRLHIV